MLRRGLAMLALLAATPAAAHHSLGGYDWTRKVNLDATVVEFRFAHPHPFLMVRARPDGGEATTYKLEMDNLYELADIGLTKTTFKPGERVIVRGDPSRTRPDELYLRRLDRPSDGLHYEQVGMSPRVNFRPKD